METYPQWWKPVCDLMVRDNLPFRRAAFNCGQDLPVEEAAKIETQHAFQRCLETQRRAFYKEIGSNAGWSKRAAIGQLLMYADKLSKDGAYDKAVEAVNKACRLEGWIGGDQDIKVFGNLSAKEFDDIRTKLKDNLERASPPGVGEPLPN